MHYWMPFSMIILLSIVLMLATGCTIRTYEKVRSTNYNYAKNKQLEEMRERNFSVIRTEMVLKGLSMNSPMLIRAFKSEMKLELWVKSTYHDHYELFKEYDICSKSGRLGPKLQEGDRQTPEGFYDVRPERMNPNSKYFLSFNIGFPNAFDRSLGRTGSHLMIHGDCVSEGCLAMTDKLIAEIYMIVEHNFKYGQASIPIHIFPFRMTEKNMALRRFSRWYSFWKNLKEGYDYFEQYYVPPEVGFRDGRYVFWHNELSLAKSIK